MGLDDLTVKAIKDKRPPVPNPVLVPLDDLAERLSLLWELLDLDADLDDPIMGETVNEVRLMLLRATLSSQWRRVIGQEPTLGVYEVDLVRFMEAIAFFFSMPKYPENPKRIDLIQFFEDVGEARRAWERLPAWFVQLWERKE